MHELAKIFGEGTLVFKGISTSWMTAIATASVLFLAFIWLFQVGKVNKWARTVATGLRFFIVLILLFLLAEPILESREVIPQQSTLIHVFDASASMKIKDYQDKSRYDAIVELASKGASTRRRLDEIYSGFDFTFDETLYPELSVAPPESPEKETNIAGALESLRIETAGLPISGVLLYTDGNDSLNQSREQILTSAAQIQAPIYCVGSAPKDPGADFWIEKVIHPSNIRCGIAEQITVLVGARGMKGEEAVLTVQGEGLDLKKTQKAGSDDQFLRFAFPVKIQNAGTFLYTASLSSSASHESYPWNNKKHFFIRAEKSDWKILYVEGSPRYEYRFLRAAFDEDERFHITSIITVSPKGQIYRQGISDPGELQNGFPDNSNDLFKYDIVIIGDVPPRMFNETQKNLIRDFVLKRGGGLLYLAGEKSFNAEEIDGTPLADILPCKIDTGVKIPVEIAIRPTFQGIERNLFGPYSPAEDSEPPWKDVPLLKGVYPLLNLKPGALPLCEAFLDENTSFPVIAYQRYGRGTCAVCGLSATWPWKFRTKSDDLRYGSFWKEMSILLVERLKRTLHVDAAPKIAPINSEIKIFGYALNDSYAPDYSAQITVVIENPEGETRTVNPNVNSSSDYTFEYKLTPTIPGIYKIKAIRVGQTDETKREAQTAFVIEGESRELREIRLNAGLLQEMSTLTGGEYVHLSEYDKLPNLIKPIEGSLFRIKEKPVWDRWAFFLVILAALLLEWLLRRLGNMA